MLPFRFAPRPSVYAAALLLATLPLAGGAQTTPKKPAAAAVPSATGSKTLSGSAGNGKLMSFKELEVCLKEQRDLNTRVPELQRQRDAMDVERKSIQAEADALKDESAKVAAFGERIKAYNARIKEQSEKVKSWRERQEAFDASERSGPSADRQRKELDKERDQLQKAQTALDAENLSLAAERDKVSAGFNERASAQEKAANDWNARSRALDGRFRAYEDDRLDWKGRCADRPYREDDEKLILRELDQAK